MRQATFRMNPKMVVSDYIFIENSIVGGNHKEQTFGLKILLKLALSCNPSAVIYCFSLFLWAILDKSVSLSIIDGLVNLTTERDMFVAIH